MREYDIVVVGGGPAGCMAAKYAAKAGASTLIIEENSAIGEPVQCAGLISKRAIEESELKNIGSFVNRELKGAIVHSQSHELRIESLSPDKRAFAIRRDIFDGELAKAAMDEGAELILNSKVKRMAGLTVTKNFLNCVQIEGQYEIHEPVADIFVGKTIAPGFFAWVIPIGETTARIGLCIDKRFSPHPNPLPFLKRILSEHPIIAAKYKGTQSKFTAGAIPIPTERQKTVKTEDGTGILLVGDAAAQIKPVTGGGVYYGMKCGKIAGEAAARACLERNMELLDGYEKRWQEEIGAEMAFGLKIHRLRCALGDKDFDRMCQALSKYDMIQRITNRGDMDYPSFVFHELLKNPNIFMLMAKSIIKYLYAKRKIR